jgi:hypothetical protein
MADSKVNKFWNSYDHYHIKVKGSVNSNSQVHCSQLFCKGNWINVTYVVAGLEGSGINGGSRRMLGCIALRLENRPNHLMFHGIDMHLLVEVNAGLWMLTFRTV